MAEPKLGLPFCGVRASALDRAGVACRWTHAPVTIAEALDLSAASITPAQVQRVFEEVASLWSSVCGIDMRVVALGPCNILAASGRLDGPNGVLGWSYLPCGNVTSSTRLDQLYDDGEAWTLSSLKRTVLHEVGHACGLDHAPVGSGAVMEPYLTEHDSPQPWDVRQMLSRYGPPVALPPPPPPLPPTEPERPGIPLKIGQLSAKYPLEGGKSRLFRFQAHAPRRFVMETTGPGAWVMSLLGPGDPTRVITMDEGMHGEGANARIAAMLPVGVYFLKVEGYFPRQSGVFRVKVVAR